jgi:hypothetical protein
MSAPNPYDATAADLFGGNLAMGARSSVTSVADTNPDEEAQLRRRAQQLGIPPESARANPKIVQQRLAGQSVDWDNMARQAPRTNKFLNSTSHAAIAHDDISVLGSIERAFTGAAGLFFPALVAVAAKPTIERVAGQTGRDIAKFGGPGGYLKALGRDRSPRNTLKELVAGVGQADEGISGAIEKIARVLGADDIADAVGRHRQTAIRGIQDVRPTYETQFGRDVGMGVEAFCLDTRHLSESLAASPAGPLLGCACE